MLLDTSTSEPVHKDLWERDGRPPHPGEVLREDILPRTGLSRAALARRMGISPQRLAAFVQERTPITADLALRLAAVLGHGARYWLGLQMQHDIWLIEQPVTFKVQPLSWAKAARTQQRVQSQST